MTKEFSFFGKVKRISSSAFGVGIPMVLIRQGYFVEGAKYKFVVVEVMEDGCKKEVGWGNYWK